MRCSHTTDGSGVHLTLQLGVEDLQRLERGSWIRVRLSDFGWLDPTGADRDVLVIRDTPEVIRWRGSAGILPMPGVARVVFLAESSLGTLRSGGSIQFEAGRERIDLTLLGCSDSTGTSFANKRNDEI